MASIRASVLLLTYLWATALLAAVSSTSGNLDFNVAEQTLARLNANGLGLGTTSPSANLHVQGNAIVSSQLFIGGNTGSSNLNLHGSLALGVSQHLNSGNLSSTSIHLVNSSSGNIVMALPAASSANGQVLTVKKTSALNNVTISSTDPIDGDTYQILMDSTSGTTLPYTKLMSSGNAWWLLQASSNSHKLNGTVAYWPLDEASGSSNVTDILKGSWGSLVNFSADNIGLPGISGNALAFDKVDNRLTIASAQTTPFDNLWVGGGSVSFWCKLNSGGKSGLQNTFFDKGLLWQITTRNEHGTSVGLRFNIKFSTSDGNFRGEPTTFSTFTLNSWHHVVLTYSSDSTTNLPTFYVDGQAIATTNNVAPAGTVSSDTGQDLFIGNNVADTTTLDGLMDEIRFYNRILSSAEIMALYRQFVP